MSEKSGLIAVVVALIGAAGVLGAKYLEVGSKTAAAQPEPKPAPVDPAPAPNPQPVDPTPRPQPVDPVRIAAPDPAPSPAIPDISGAWHDIQHATYVIAQQGGAILITSPQFTGTSGSGTVIGSAVQWDYRDSNGVPGRCAGMVTEQQLQIVCTAMGVSYAFPMHRPNSG